MDRADGPSAPPNDRSRLLLIDSSPLLLEGARRLLEATGSRGGDRSANQVLWRIVMVRMVHDPDTRCYVERRTREGRSKREIIRSLKRYVARQLYRHLPRPDRRPRERGDDYSVRCRLAPWSET